MGYVEDNLMEGEKILYRAKLHWAFFIGPVLIFLIALMFGVFATLGKEDSTTSSTCCMPIFFFILALLTGIDSLVSYLTTEFALTDRRIIAKTGFIRRRSVDLLLTKVESIGVNQPILGRLLDFGTIIVTGTGGTREPFKNIAQPLELRHRVTTQISSNKT